MSLFSGQASEARAGLRPFTLPGVERVYERSRPFKIDHIALDLALDVPGKAVSGTATVEVRRIDRTAREIVLDAVGFDVQAVEISSREAAERGASGWEAAAYIYDGDVLTVTIPESVPQAAVRVRYRVVPRRGLYFLAPDEHVTDRPQQVWTQCQDEDARHLFPCHDKPHIKQTTELKVAVPEGWFALSNGELVGDVKGQGTRTFHYRMNEPHPSYLFTLVAGDFARIDAEADNVPLSYFVPKGCEADGARTFGRTPDMIRHFSKLTGVPYPWGRYSQIVVSDFIFGGMENTTATTMYEHILLDERAAIDVTSDDLIAHELAHQWFGDLVTCRDWSHAWLNEGFATFMEQIDREQKLGRDEYDHAVKADMDTYISEARSRYRRPIVCQDYQAPIDIFDRHLYEKAACVLHLLRRELGDEVFWSGVQAYLTRHAKGVVETRDLMRAMEDVSGRGLERFFEQWIYRPGHPEIEIEIEYEREACTVKVKQAQVTSPSHSHGHPGASGEASTPIFAFDLAIDVAFEGESGLRREVRRIDQAGQVLAIHAPRRPRFMVIDPELSVLGEVRVKAPGDMLRAQLAHAPTARGRMLAIASLAKLDDPPTTQALGRALANEQEFWGVRAEAASALGQLRSEEAFTILSAQVNTSHPKVRRAIVSALGSFRTSKSLEVLKPLALRDPSYLVEAEAARALGCTRQAAAFDTLIDVIDRRSWADVVRTGAIDGLAQLRDERAIPHLTARTRYGVSTRGRRAAIVALPKLSGDRRTREVLEELLDSADPYLRVDVVRALSDLGDVKSRPALQRQLERDLDGRVRRRIREALRDLGGSGKREADRLRDELEALRGEHAELKSRLAKVEAGMKAGGEKKRKEGKKR